MDNPNTPFSLLSTHHTRGSGQGEVLFSDTALSFWGGVNPETGEIIDRHHPLSGQSLVGKVLAIPSGRGSCTGSSVLLEIILNGHGPAAIVLQQADEILILGALIAGWVFAHPLPVVSVGAENFQRLRHAQSALIQENGQLFADSTIQPINPPSATKANEPLYANINLSDLDKAMLQGQQGMANKVAMQIVLQMATLQGATELIDVVQGHIDGCIYTGSASLRFANQLRDWGGKVCIPTTLNAISVDQRCWRKQGVDPVFGEPASALADAYVAIGCVPSFTCAPYLLASAPKAGQEIVWAESNAVVYANSVIGARTAKYADFLDICIALIGRAPKASCHVNENRFATLVVYLPENLKDIDDAFYPLLGYLVGLIAGTHIPVIVGLESAQPSFDDMKAFGAAFATTSAAPMFHIVNVTPEAATLERTLGGQTIPLEHHITSSDLKQAWHELNNTQNTAVDLIALGNPHFSETEFRALAQWLKGKKCHDNINVVVTTGRDTHAKAQINGDIAILEASGVQIVTDTCWCMINEPIVPPHARVIMTNSGKYAHYAPGLTGRSVRFGSLAQCAQAACSGQAGNLLPPWLLV